MDATLDLAGELEADHVVFRCAQCEATFRVWMDARGEPCPNCKSPLRLHRIVYAAGWVTPECLVGAVPAVMAGKLREYGVTDPERVIRRANELKLWD